MGQAKLYISFSLGLTQRTQHNNSFSLCGQLKDMEEDVRIIDRELQSEAAAPVLDTRIPYPPVARNPVYLLTPG